MVGGKGALDTPNKIHFHRLGVHECLVDLITGFKPDIAVVDARQGWDVDHGIPVGALLGGLDPVAIDYLGTLLTRIDVAMLRNP